MLDDACKREFVDLTQSFGADAYFAEPVAFPEYSDNRRGIGTDPFAQLPSVQSIVVLLWGYRPVRTREAPPLSAYYIASNCGHHCAEQLRQWLLGRGAEAVMADLPVKAVLEHARIAGVGRNTLAATKGKGSYFYAKLILTDAFAPEEQQDLRAPCLHCGRCAKACPVGAIGESFDMTRCIRAHYDGGAIPENVKQAMGSLLGCEICQRTCPRNSAIPPADAGRAIEELFSLDRLIETYPKKQLAGLVGKNMAGGGRLQAQALILAAKAKDFSHIGAASGLAGSDRPCLADAARWYLGQAEASMCDAAAKDSLQSDG